MRALVEMIKDAQKYYLNFLRNDDAQKTFRN